MPLPADLHTMQFHRSGALDVPSAQVAKAGPYDANASLGGFRAAQRVSHQSTLTSAMTQLGTLVDTTQVQAVPAGPIVYTTPATNSGAYVSAASLLHWYRFSLNPYVDGNASQVMHYGLGTDYATVGARVHLDLGRGAAADELDITDVDVAQQPGHFDAQRGSLYLNSGGAADGQALVSTASTLGIANVWSISFWCRTDTIAAGTSVLFHARVSGAATSLLANSIRVQRQTGDLHLDIVDTGGVANTKEYEYAGFFSAATWVHLTITWDGTNLLLYKNGAFLAASTVASDDSVTMTDTSRRILVGGGINNTTDPTQEWFGHVHSMCIWTNELTAAEVAAVYGLGDGVGHPYGHVGDWLVFISGTAGNRMQARKIAFHNTLTGEMHLEQPLPALGAVGDVYRIGKSDFLFDDGPTAEECSTGVIDHRCIVFHNLTTEQLTDVRFYLVPLDPRSITFEIAASDTAIGATDLPDTPDDLTDPAIKTGLGANGFSTNIQTFRRTQEYGAARGTPSGAAGAAVNIASQAEHGIWIRRTAAPLTRVGKSAWLLVATAESAGVSGVGPWSSATVLVSEPVGFVSEFTVAFDRSPRTFGGARVTAHAEDAVTNTPVEDLAITFELTTGPGTIETEDPQPVYTDGDGDAAAQYHGPDDEGDAGATVVVTAHYIGD